MVPRIQIIITSIFLSFMLSGALPAQIRVDPDNVEIGEKEYSPHLNDNYPKRVLWGDTHVHTSYSTDAGMIGNRLDPEEAYRFALGEEVVSSTGVRAKLLRPLDFLVVADHAENLGLAPMIEESNSALLKIAWGKEVHDLVKAGKGQDAYAEWGARMSAGEDPLKDKKVERSMWERITAFAEKYNQPGRFTAFIGFEWTASPLGSNLHRNVIFRDDKGLADRVLPFSNYDSTDPEDLWQWMSEYEAKTGGQVLALAHNGNLSNGLMFDDVTLSGDPLDRAYAISRMRWEPLYEVTQMKGDGETHPSLSPNDEFADYGTWDRGSFAGAPDQGSLRCRGDRVRLSDTKTVPGGREPKDPAGGKIQLTLLDSWCLHLHPDDIFNHEALLQNANQIKYFATSHHGGAPAY